MALCKLSGRLQLLHRLVQWLHGCIRPCGVCGRHWPFLGLARDPARTSLRRCARRAPSSTQATQATTGKTVADAISGVISQFGGYGVNNPAVVSFAPCPTCAVPDPNDLSEIKPLHPVDLFDGVPRKQAVQSVAGTAFYTLTMTFAYNPGFTFNGLSGLFYTAFGSSLFQARPACVPGADREGDQRACGLQRPGSSGPTAAALNRRTPRHAAHTRQAACCRCRSSG